MAHRLLRLEQDLESVVHRRIRGLRQARGWSLDALAARCHLSPSSLSRIETGHRRIALDQLAAIARALDTSLDALVEAGEDADVVIRPVRDEARGTTSWTVADDRGPRGMRVAKIRMERPVPLVPVDELGVHPGRDWFTVLEGTARLQLGERVLLVRTGEAAEFSTMVPHALAAHDGPAEVLVILDRDGEHAHLGPSAG